MKKVKLKINYTIPNDIHRLKKSDILELSNLVYSEKNGYNLSKDFVESNPDIFEKLKPLFYTEDFADGSFPKKSCNNCSNFNTGRGAFICAECIHKIPSSEKDYWQGDLKGEAVYKGDKCWLIHQDKIPWEDMYSNWNGNSMMDSKAKYFSNKANARDYYNSLKEVELKIGTGHRSFGADKNTKFVTVDGIKKYKGDKVWLVQVIGDFEITEDIVGETPFLLWYKIYNSLENAEQYKAEQTALKRHIKVNTIVFSIYDKTPMKILRVVWDNEDDCTAFYIKDDLKIANYTLIKYVQTLEELAKEEGLKIGMKLNHKLLNDWYYKILEDKSFNYEDTDEITEITEFKIWVGDNLNNTPAFVYGYFTFPLAGFKAFKEEWENNNIKLSKVNRIEVIDNEGRAYVNNNAFNVFTNLQDDNKTLKIFTNIKK